jgi:hypothetical protein
VPCLLARVEVQVHPDGFLRRAISQLKDTGSCRPVGSISIMNPGSQSRSRRA